MSSHSFFPVDTDVVDQLFQKQNARATMAPQEAPDAAVKEQPQPRPSSGSDLTKENATAGIISNESLTVREIDVDALPSLFLSLPLSLLFLSPS